jgi:hypothetical protein
MNATVSQDRLGGAKRGLGMPDLDARGLDLASACSPDRWRVWCQSKLQALYTWSR